MTNFNILHHLFCEESMVLDIYVSREGEKLYILFYILFWGEQFSQFLFLISLHWNIQQYSLFVYFLTT